MGLANHRVRGSAIRIAACACLLAAPSLAEDEGAAPAETRATEIVVTRAARECFTDLIHASGYIVPRQTAVVMFPVPGYLIREVRAKTGDTVKRGDVVARAVPAGAAAPKAATPDVVNLRSPAAGVVLQSTAFEGMPTSSGAAPLFTLAVDGAIEASVDVPSVHILELVAGQPAHLTMRDGSVLDAHVRRTPAIIDRASQMGSTRLSIDTRRATLDISRFVRATIEARRSCGVGVPMAALRRTSVGATIQVVKDGVIIDRAVRLGLANATDSEVTSGLAEGELVVAGTGSSRDGDRVTPILSDTRDAR